jgi:hypothetical protein
MHVCRHGGYASTNTTGEIRPTVKVLGLQGCAAAQISGGHLDNFQVNLIRKNNCIMMMSYEKIRNNIMASYIFIRKP